MILTNCRLVPELCEGFQEEYADIRIEGDSIAEILPTGGRYTGEETLDCSGRTVLPGLHNLHIHLWFFTFNNEQLTYADNEYDMQMHSMHYMNTLLAYGYTSLRDVGSPYNLAVKMKNDINAGRLTGPRLKASGYILTPHQYCPVNLHCHSDKYGLAINNAMQAREIARKQLVDGADFIKILGSSVTGLDRDESSLFYPDELDALEEVARREHTYVSVHTNTQDSTLTAIERENYSIEHGNMLDQECIDALVKHGFKSRLVTTASASWYFGGDDLAKIANGMHKDAAEAGVLIGWGTDAMEDVFLAEPGAEFRLREKVLGFSRIDVLKQATINSAVINQDDQNVGTIKVGKKADLAIFDGKPDEDFEVFNHPAAYVIRDGVLVVDHGMVKCI